MIAYKYTLSLSLSVTQTLLVSFLPSSKNKEVHLFHFSAMELNKHNNGGRNDAVAGGSRPQAVHEGNENSFLCRVCGKKFPKIKALNGHMRTHSNRSQQPGSTRRPRTNIMEPHVNCRNIPDLNELPDEADMMIMEPYQNVRNIPDLNELPDPEDDQI